MKETVLVTTFNREELLWLCLEAIRRQDSEIGILIFSDRGAESDDLSEVSSYFSAPIILRPKHSRYGNSWNLLAACEQFSGNMDTVHLIEDDTIIHPGYLRWARDQLSLPYFQAEYPWACLKLYAAVCARISSPHIPNWYESPCASWNGDFLRVALSHLIPEYFCESRAEMQRFLDERMFPRSKYKKGGAEQDGFFLRCVEYHNWKTCFPPKPLATHLGWWGYNSPSSRARPTGKLTDRVADCRAMLKNREERRKLFGHKITALEMEGMGL